MFFRSLALLLALTGAAIPLSAKSPAAEYPGSPLVFEPNRGQVASTVRFLSHGNGHSFLLKESEAVLSFADPALTVRMKLVGQNPHPVIEPSGLQPGVTNYFHGSDPAKWQTSIPHFQRIKYASVYPGIDLIYYGSGRQLEYDFELQPLIDPSTIAIEFQGVSQVSIGPEGDLILTTSAGEIRHRRPVAFQWRGGEKEPVEAAFVVREGHVGFSVGRYDRRRPLTIDPTLVWSSLLGSTGNDQGNDIAVDASGNAYIAGYTNTVASEGTDADGNPLPISLVTPIEKSFEAFLTKLNSSGAIVYTTYFGGTPVTGNTASGVDEAHSVALDAAGDIYIVGYTTSANFPIVSGFQTTLRGVQDAYLVRLDNASGSIQFSTFLGGNQSDRAYGVAVDAVGNAYVTGATISTDFPIAGAFQSRFGGGLRDGFLTKITVGGTIGFSTYVGGSGDEEAYDVALDSSGNAILTGHTSSQNFPVANALFRTFLGGTDDIFITKLNPTGSGLVFSTYWGGAGSDNGVRLATDADNKIYVTGYTTSNLDFPLKSPAQFLNAGAYDAFLIKLHPDGQDADFSTFIGAEDTDGGTAIAVDNAGFIYLTGFTNSLGFYAINSVGGFLRGDRDGFLMKIAPDASVVLYSTYLGGFGTEGGTSVAVDSAGNAYVTGFSSSAIGFPFAANAFQNANAGGQDAFVMKINADDVKVSVPYAFPVNGGARIATAGQTSRPIFGYLAVDVDGGLPPSGLTILDLRSGGALLNEVSIPVPSRELVGRVFVRTDQANSTAVTIVNPNDVETPVAMYFTANGQGTNFFRSFTIPAHGQVSGFVYSEPFAIPINQVGTMTFTSDLPVSAIALRANSGGTPQNVWLPVMNPYAANHAPLTIPQFADGGLWSGSIHLINPTEETITGELRFFQRGLPGEPGTPVTLATDQGTASVIPYSIEPRQSQVVSTHTEPFEIIAGYVDIVPTGDTFAPHAYAVLSFAETGLISTTVEAVPAAAEFKMYVETSGTFPEDLAATPALSLVNSSDFPATVTLSLTNFDGTDSGLSGVVSLPPRGHVGTFLTNIPGFENLPSPYAGMLKLTTTAPAVTMAGFRVRYSELRQFMITMTGPLKDVGNDNPVIFPHLVDGGGYATQFILLPGAAGTGATGTIRYLDSSGKPLNVAIAPE